MIMVHPGLHEEFTPQEYIVDMKRMVVVVRLQLQFNDEVSGKVWPAKLASAHYNLVLDENNELKIKKIIHFTEATFPEEAASPKEESMMELWKRYREKALVELGNKWINAQASEKKQLNRMLLVLNQG